MKRTLGYCWLGLSFVVLAQACGSSEGKKKVPPSYTSGGEGGEGANGSGGGPAAAGKAGSTAMAGAGNEAGQSTTEGGSPGAGGNPTQNEAGNSSAPGGAGAGGQSSSGECPTGFGECDGNPDTVCEQDLSLVTSCGDCSTKCISTNGGAVCTDLECVLTCNANYDDCDAKPETGCESNVTSDDHNCGSCGHDCTLGGAKCTSGLCDSIPLQQGIAMGSDNSGARSWAFSPLGIIGNGFNSYTVRRMPLDGKTPLTVWAAAGKTSPTEGLVVVDGDVYWSERGAATNATYLSVVYKKAITADAATLPTPVFVPEYSATFLQRQGNALYWASGGYQDEAYYVAGGGGFIYTRALDAAETDGGTRIVTVNQGNWDNFKALAVTTDALYWVTDQNTGTPYELRTAPLAGAPISVVPAVFANASLAVSNYGGRPSLVQAGAYVYFNRDANDAQDGIYRFKAGLAKPERIALADNVLSLQVDATYVYFVQQNTAGIWRAPINGGAGGAAEKLTTASASRLVGVDDTFVYGASISCCSTNLLKIVK